MAKSNKRSKKRKSKEHKPGTKGDQPRIKISEAILNLSEPLRKKFREPHRVDVIVHMTIMAWNISLFPKEEQLGVQETLVNALPKEFNAEDLAILMENIDILVERKQKEYPEIREFIAKQKLSFSGDKITLTVGSAPVPDKIERRTS